MGLFTFTFDDGVTTNFDLLLPILKKENIKATFFVIGQTLRTKKRQKILQDVYKAGHIIGNHTYSHTNLTRLTKSGIVSEINRTTKAIQNAGVFNSNYFRPPYGALNKDIAEYIQERGITTVLWNVDMQDWNLNVSKDMLLQRYKDFFAKANSTYSYISLQHTMRKDSILLVPEIAKMAKERGFRISSIKSAKD